MKEFSEIKLQTEDPETPFKEPDSPQSPTEPNPYPVTDPVTEPTPAPEPFPAPPEPIPEMPPDVVF
ncbi:MAG TPA: hypothetical protein VGC76_10700 [Pyrinomonadaceae bacterium]|jgi:hypothetical protein